MDYESPESYDSSGDVPSTSEERQIVKRVILSACPEPCKVCGGEATGYHYEVSSCNGCKSFFRRTIIGNRKFQCAFRNNCLIQKHPYKKRECRACRFSRCIEVGMNPYGNIVRSQFALRVSFEAIVTDDASELDAIRAIKRTDHALPMKRIISTENLMECSLHDLLYSEIKLNLLRRSTHNFRPDCGFTIDSLLNQFTPLGSSFPEMPPLMYWKMKPFDMEFHLQNRIPLPPVDYSQFPSNFKFWFYMDMVYQLAWITSFDFFKSLERTDQIVLVRIVTLQLMILTTSYFSYTNKSSSCVFPDGSYFIWSDKVFDAIRNCYEIRLEHGEYVLLKALLLCNPTWEQLSSSARRSLSVIQRKYTSILMDHCLRTHGVSKGPARMAALLQLKNTIIHKASKARSRIELMTILKIRSCREILVDQICDVDKL